MATSGILWLGPRGAPGALNLGRSVPVPIDHVGLVPNISAFAILIRQGKSSQNAHFGIPRISFPEFLDVHFRGITVLSNRKPQNFPEFSSVSLEKVFWGPQMAYLGEDQVDMLGSCEPYRSQ